MTEHQTVPLEDFVTRRPDWRRETTVKAEGGRVIRAVVERDFYANQNRVYSETWSSETASWNRVQTLAGYEYEGLPSSGSKDNDAIFAASQPVVDALIAYALKVVA